MYIKRNADGAIVAVSKVAEPGIQEHLADDSAELQAFLQSLRSDTQLSLEESDQEMARVMEDLVYLLIEREIIRFTDLPQPAQAKMMARREMRDKVRGVDLLGDEDEGVGL